MALETWSAKMDAELKNEIQEIIKEDFPDSRSFIERVIELYKLDKTRTTGDVLSKEVAELMSLTSRINNLFVNANEHVHSLLKEKELEAEKASLHKDELIQNLKEKLCEKDDKIQELEALTNESNSLISHYKEEVDQLEKSSNALELLNKEYAIKIEALSITVNTNQEKVNKINELEAQAQEYQNALVRFANQVEELENKLKSKDKELDEMNKKYLAEISSLQSHSTEQLEFAKRKYEVEANMSKLELQAEYEEKLRLQRAEYIEEVEMYRDKYRQILEHLEHMKS